MENVPYIFPACYGIRQNERKHENFVLPFLLSFRVQPIRIGSFIFSFIVARFEKTGSARPNCDLPVDGCKGRVRVGKRFIFCRAVPFFLYNHKFWYQHEFSAIKYIVILNVGVSLYKW